MNDLIATLADVYRQLDSHQELYRATVDISRDSLGADAAIVSSQRNREGRSIATAPREFADPDDLLSPISLPQIAAAEGQSYIIDDKSNVRSAACDAHADHGAAVTYRSLVWVPFGDGGFLLAASREKTAFGDGDLDRLQVIRDVTTLAHHWLDEAPNEPTNEEVVEHAAAFLSHDASNHLSVLRGRLELAQETGEADHLESMGQTIDRLAAVIEDTVTVLRTGGHARDFREVSLAEVAHRAWDAANTEQASLTIIPMEPIMADESRLCQLLENLFRNAVQHAGPDVTVTIGPLETECGFYVEDDGQGINLNNETSLFELGYSTDEAHSGVGLAIVQQIAQAHDWEVSMEASESGGARFEFRGVEVPRR